jgi:protein-S-isoprenylcysteine O-methyltransferase Ste14
MNTSSTLSPVPPLRRRIAVLGYGLFSYAIFFATFCYAFGFIGDFFVPQSIDSTPTMSFGRALLVNLGLLALFAVQHSVMARPAFKRWWTKFVPHAIERSTYLLASCVVIAVLILCWRPIPIVIWDVASGPARQALWGLFFAGWLMVPAVSLLISHFDLFGLRQAWLYWRGRPYQPLAFRTPGLYAWVRHPLYIGWAIAFWATPTMTVGHLLFAVGMCAYMLIAVQFEERDLVAHFGGSGKKPFDATNKRTWRSLGSFNLNALIVARPVAVFPRSNNVADHAKCSDQVS